jgi:dipeptidyl aminopeptidase/acylaminoacyl peptidase
MMRRFVLLLCLGILFVSPLYAQKRAFTIEDLYRIKNISDLKVSPDGRILLYTTTTSDLPRGKRLNHVWIMNSDGTNARQLIQNEKSDYSPAFSPDGKWISFISTRDGDPNLYVVSANGSQLRRVTNISTGVSDPLWSPDGRFVAFSTDVYPECGADDACNKRTAERWENGPLKAHMADQLFYRHWTEWKDGKRTHIFLTTIANGEISDLTPGDHDSPSFQLGGPLQYDFSPDGSELVYVSNHDQHPESSTNNDLWLISLKDRNPSPRNITSSNPAYDGSPKYSPDGRYIAFRMQKQPAYESDLFRIALYDRATGTSKVLTESFRNWIDEFHWSRDSKSLYFTGPVEGVNPIYRLDLPGGGITKLFTDKTIDAFDFSPDERRLFYIKRSVGEPNEIYSASLGTGVSTPGQMSHVNDAVVKEVDIRPAETMWVNGAGGTKVEVFIVKPHNFDPSKKYPLILNVHGGPQSQWADAFRGDWQVYPGAGYIVAFPNPHGSTGYGQDYTSEISGDWGGKVFEDLMKVTDALEKLTYVDRDRMGAMGWSYGGYMMNFFEGHTDRFKAIASMMGIYDLRSFYGGTEELWFPEWDLKGQPWNSQIYEKWSPSNSVKNFKTPCLIISGERDYRIPYTQSLQFFTALQKMNVPSRLIIYQNAGHWPNWHEMAFYYTAHLEWFNKYLGGGPAPWTAEQFLRNAVFDKATGKRLIDSEAGPGPNKNETNKQAAPRNRQGKPDEKPKTP